MENVKPTLPNTEEWQYFYGDEFLGEELSDMWRGEYFPYYKKDSAKTNYEFENGKLVLKIYDEQDYWNKDIDAGYKSTGIFGAMRDFNHIFSDKLKIEKHCPTFDKFVTKYGYFELRAKLPKGSGMCPAWWMIGFQDKITENAEIDIFEVLGKEPNKISFTLHPLGDPNLKYHHEYIDTGVDLSKDFHTYGLLWQENLLRLYFDGKPIGEFDEAPNYRMMTIISLNQHNNNDWLGPLDKTLDNPRRYEIDYFRVFKRKNSIEDVKVPDFYVSSYGVDVEQYRSTPPYFMNDGEVDTFFKGNKNNKYIYIDFNHETEVSSLNLVSTKNYEINKVNIERSIDGISDWKEISGEVNFVWSDCSNSIVKGKTEFEKVVGRYFRVEILEVNRKDGLYEINEINLK